MVSPSWMSTSPRLACRFSLGTLGPACRALLSSGRRSSPHKPVFVSSLCGNCPAGLYQTPVSTVLAKSLLPAPPPHIVLDKVLANRNRVQATNVTMILNFLGKRVYLNTVVSTYHRYKNGYFTFSFVLSL